MERGMGVSWADLSMDQRAQTLLAYAQQLPDSQRTQFLAEAGFAPELINRIGVLVSPAGMTTIADTRAAVSGATPAATAAQMRAYKASDVAKQRATEAQIQQDQLAAGPQYASWQQRLQRTTSRFEVLAAAGEDRFSIRDKIEPARMAAIELMDELNTFINEAESHDPRKAEAIDLRDRISREIDIAGHPVTQWYPDSAHRLLRTGQEVTQGFNTIINNNQNVIYNQPEQPAARRSGPEDLN